MQKLTKKQRKELKKHFRGLSEEKLNTFNKSILEIEKQRGECYNIYCNDCPMYTISPCANYVGTHEEHLSEDFFDSEETQYNLKKFKKIIKKAIDKV